MEKSDLVICLGLQKSYTTSLYTYFRENNICQINRFNKEEASILRGKLPKNFKYGEKFLDVCPLYGIHIHQFCKEMKLLRVSPKFIIIHREPIERIKSHIKMLKRRDDRLDIIKNLRREVEELALSEIQKVDLGDYLGKIDKIIPEETEFNFIESQNMIKINSVARIYESLHAAGLVNDKNVCIVNSNFISQENNLKKILDFCECSNLPSLSKPFPHSHRGSSTRRIDFSKISRALLLNKLPKQIKTNIKKSGLWNYIEMNNSTKKPEYVQVP